MTVDDLANEVEARLGPVPESVLELQTVRWEKSIARGPFVRARSLVSPVAVAAAVLVGVLALVLVNFTGAEEEAVAVAPQGVLVGGAYEFDLRFEDTLRHIELAPSEVLTVSPGARGRVERSSAASTLVTLSEGAMALSVPSGTGREWAVTAGPYRIEVVGTEFSVTWLAETGQLTVAVERGTVRVSGGEITRPRLLQRGERFVKGPPPSPSTRSSAAPPIESTAPVVSTAPAAPSWRALQQQRQYRDALAAAEREGFDRLCASLGPAELVALANTARLAGSAARARQALQSVRQRYPGTSEAATAAFLLGREGSSVAHRSWLESYLVEQPGGPYAQEALGRLMVGYRSTGDTGRARAKAQAYLRAHPRGAYAEHARSILGSPSAPSGQ